MNRTCGLQTRFDKARRQGLADIFCVGCDIPFPLNEQGLCEDCFAKLERDLIRARDWDYSVAAFLLSDDQREALRERIIQAYGPANELLVDVKKPRRKNKRSHSRATQHKREIAAQAIRNYNIHDVLQSARDFIGKQQEEWINVGHVLQHLYESFYKLNPKQLGRPEKKYKSLLKMLADYPSDFELRQDLENKGVYWIRLT
jgi:hypothetical protein